MSEEKHEFTSGEWFRAGNQGVAIHAEGRGALAYITVGEARGRTLPEAQANAALQASAPDLLRACERCLPEWWEEAIIDIRKGNGEICCEITYGDVRAIADALKKARLL